jgi:phenylacetate-coenzyme A ligase PaaK-like adenylate-forming protein
MSELLTMIRAIREARRNQTLTRAQLEEAKLGRFRELVLHAQRHSPYYAQLIEERGIRVSACTPADFPVLTKTLLMANFDRIATDRRVTKQAIADFLTRSKDPTELYLGEFRVLHTSGTSGEMGYFVYSPDDWARGMTPGAMRRRSGSQRRGGFGRIRIGFFGATGGHYAGVSMMMSSRRGLARLFLRVEAFEVNRPLPETLERLNAYQPHFLSGYTNALKVLAERQRAGSLRIAPMAIAATGETVTAADMHLLRDAFGAEVFSAYGCTEHLMLGASNPDGATMTLFDDNLIFEFRADHSLITNLFNRTLPLIRYRMSDILRPVAGSDPASRQLVVENLVGRTELPPTFVNRDGVEDFISPITIAEIFVAGVTRFQMHLTAPTAFRFLMCLDPSLDETGRATAIAAMRARLREILVQKGLDNVTFDVAVVDELPADPRSRKFRLIVDRRSEEMKAAG